MSQCLPFPAWVALSLSFLATACPHGDVGAPCNHGAIDPPVTRTVTFPAITCDDLLCIYGDDTQTPTTDCQRDADCNVADPENPVFACVKSSTDGNGRCTLTLEHVLERSMCSRSCSSDDDCNNTSSSNQPAVEDSACATEFRCVVLQSLGDFCCEKLCVCNDDLASGSHKQLEQRCAAGRDAVCKQDAS